MSRELTAVLVAFLALGYYTIYSLVTSGALIFPFPLNETIFAVLTLQFCYWERHWKLRLFLPVMIALLAILSSPFFWEIMLPYEELIIFYDTATIDILKLLFLLSIIFAGVAMVLHQEKWQARALGIFGMGLFVIGYLADLLWYEWSGVVLTAIAFMLEPVYKPFHLLWFLLAGLVSTEVLTFLFA